MDGAKHLSLAQRLMAAGVHKSHAYQLAQKSSPRVALRIFKRTGIRIGPLEQATDEEIKVLERIEGRAA